MEKVSGVARFVAFDLTDFNSSTIISPDVESGVAVGFRMKDCVGVSITGMYSEAIYHTLFDVSQGGCYLDIGPGNYFQNAGSITAGASGSVSGSIIFADTMTAYTPYGFSNAGTPIINLSSPNAGMNIIGGPTDIKTQNPTSKSRYLGQYGLALGNTVSTDPTTMDWYEENTFTPVIIGSSSAGVGTYSVQEGTFTRVGNRVFVQISLVWSAHTGTGNILLGGFTYAPKLTKKQSLPVGVANLTYTSGKNLYLYIPSQSNTAYNLFEDGAVVAMDTAGSLYVNGHYEV
jgi:hypothetical protein